MWLKTVFDPQAESPYGRNVDEALSAPRPASPASQLLRERSWQGSARLTGKHLMRQAEAFAVAFLVPSGLLVPSSERDSPGPAQGPGSDLL